MRSTSLRRSVLTASAALLTAAVATPWACRDARAQDAVDLQVVGNGNVRGTIRPAYERESFLTVIGRGTKIQATVKASAKKGAFIPRLELVGPMDETLLTGTTKGRSTKLTTPQAMTAGGGYRLRVFGDNGADGDYQLAFTVKPQKSFTGTGTAAPSEADLTYTFGAPAGSKARIVLKAKKSGFVPALDSLGAPGGATTALSGAASAPISLTEPGDWTVRFHDGGTAGGDWTCQVVLTLPKPRATKVDISAAALTGKFADQQPVYGRYVTPGDGDVEIDPPDTGSEIDGASVSIPAGGMPYPVVITMNQSPPFPPGEGNHPAGPAVEFGPSGIEFTKSATIKIPYDPAQFTDPANELEVYVSHDGGAPEKVAPRTILDFSEPGYVSFPAPGFSTYMSASNRPRPVTGRWAVASIFASVGQDFGGSAGVTVGRLDFTPGIEVPQFYLNLFGLESTWSRTAFPPAEDSYPAAKTESAYESDSGTYYEYNYGSADLITVYGSDETPTQLVRAPGGDVLLVTPSGNSDIDLSFALRAAEGYPTLVNVAGDWHVIAVSASAEEMGGNPRRVQLATEAALGTATFTTDGRVVIVVGDDSYSETEFPTGSWTTRKTTFRGTGKVEVGDGGLYLSLPGDTQDVRTAKPRAVTYEDPFQLYPCLDGDVLLGAHQSPSQEPMLFLFVRQGRGLGKASLNGNADVLSFARVLVSDLESPVPQQLQAEVLAGDLRHDGKGGMTRDSGYGLATSHDLTGMPTVSSVSGTGTASATYTLSATGDYRDSTGVRGALVPSGAALFGIATGNKRATFQLAVPGLTYFTDKR